MTTTRKLMGIDEIISDVHRGIARCKLSGLTPCVILCGRFIYEEIRNLSDFRGLILGCDQEMGVDDFRVFGKAEDEKED